MNDPKKGVACYHIMIIHGMLLHMKSESEKQLINVGLAEGARALDEDDVPGAMGIINKCYSLSITQLNKEGITYQMINDRLGNDINFMRRVFDAIHDLGYTPEQLEAEMIRQEHLIRESQSVFKAKQQAQFDLGINVKDVGAC